jgi:hypothetical protein
MAEFTLIRKKTGIIAIIKKVEESAGLTEIAVR